MMDFYTYLGVRLNRVVVPVMQGAPETLPKAVILSIEVTLGWGWRCSKDWRSVVENNCLHRRCPRDDAAG